jgi:DNA-binding response OmpR family regulator
MAVADNGVGIAPEALQKLFTIFYQAEDKRNKYRGGTGLGLNMTKELVQLLGGRITVESEPDKGSTFTVLLPVVQSDAVVSEEGLPEARISDGENAAASVDIVALDGMTEVPIDATDAAHGGLILVVEDNRDMRLYIRSILSPAFKILEDSNGQEGLNKALESVPDIIISDVMMPEMNGMELLAQIKSDERINHIPVILLTAVHEEEQIVRSFDVGVDDYITKPFNASILKARVSNILSNRRKWWERYAAVKGEPDGNGESGESAPTVYEEKYISPFVQKMTDVVARNIADPEYNVDLLASELCMSASQLTRKTKALMNITPYNFIIKTRMEYAALQIRQCDKNISEIAFECGYQEKSNFSRAFTKHFGMSPVQYRKEQG